MFQGHLNFTCLLNKTYKSLYSNGLKERTEGESIAEDFLVQESFQCIRSHQLYSLVYMCTCNKCATFWLVYGAVNKVLCKRTAKPDGLLMWRHLEKLQVTGITLSPSAPTIHFGGLNSCFAQLFGSVKKAALLSYQKDKSFNSLSSIQYLAWWVICLNYF